MKEAFTFDDVLIAPRFSGLRSRADVDLSGSIGLNGREIDAYSVPVISANMDTITGVEMAKAMAWAGGLACLHRFWSIAENVAAFEQVGYYCAPWVSVGVGAGELERATALYRAGARVFIIDVAHGAQVSVAEQYVAIKKQLPDTFVIVGNFGNAESVNDFHLYVNGPLGANLPLDGVKIGIGPGSACTTRIQTGVGVPQISAIQEIRQTRAGLIIADGGCRSPGDVAKALAAGANLVMLGGMLAGTNETPGRLVDLDTQEEVTGYAHDFMFRRLGKRYRGSASKESYDAQGKVQGYITAEGEAFNVPAKGPAASVLQDIEGGLRSAFSYVGAQNIEEFHESAKLVRVTGAGYVEGTPHGKR